MLRVLLIGLSFSIFLAPSTRAELTRIDFCGNGVDEDGDGQDAPCDGKFERTPYVKRIEIRSDAVRSEIFIEGAEREDGKYLVTLPNLGGSLKVVNRSEISMCIKLYDRYGIQQNSWRMDNKESELAITRFPNPSDMGSIRFLPACSETWSNRYLKVRWSERESREVLVFHGQAWNYEGTKVRAKIEIWPNRGDLHGGFPHTDSFVKCARMKSCKMGVEGRLTFISFEEDDYDTENILETLPLLPKKSWYNSSRTTSGLFYRNAPSHAESSKGVRLKFRDRGPELPGEGTRIELSGRMTHVGLGNRSGDDINSRNIHYGANVWGGLGFRQYFKMVVAYRGIEGL